MGFGEELEGAGMLTGSELGGEALPEAMKEY